MKQYEDLPAKISHPAHPAHELELADSVPFVCDGCEEPGCGPRYTHDYGSHSFDLHTCCALAKYTLKHPLFGNRTFKLLEKPLPPVEGTVCDACGESARGLVYHCCEKDLDLHPCCASLPEHILQDGRVFELRRKTSQPCGMCGESGRRRRFWAYRTNVDGEDMDIHVACMKGMARLTWQEDYQNRVGVGQVVQASLPNMDRMLQSLPRNNRRRNGFDQFIKILNTVASIIIAVIFGNPVAMMAAIAGPCGFLRG